MAIEKYFQYINLKDSDNFQQVYASQIYGTFFTVQAKFHTLQRTPSEGDYFIESVDFEVINYKGVLDIGLVMVEGPDKFAEELNDSTIKMFHLQMRGFCPNQQIDLPRSKILNFPVNEWINQGDTIYFSRTLKMLHDDEIALSKGIFDTEFFYREGQEPEGGYQEVSPKPKQVALNPVNPLSFVSGTLCTENITKTS